MSNIAPQSDLLHSRLKITEERQQALAGHNFHLPEQLIEKIIEQFGHLHSSFCLFLDIDGTLADFCSNPQDSYIPAETLAVIERLVTCGVPVIAVTGRHIAVAQQLFKQVRLPIAGLHGLNIALDDQHYLSPDLSHIDFNQLKQRLTATCAAYPQLLLEDKTHSFALHYRQHPELASIAIKIMQTVQDEFKGTRLSHGKCVIEIVPEQASKGYAIRTLLTQLKLDHSTAIFIGDDVTDEAGFSVVNQLGGLSIKVGSGKTHAQYRLANTQAVHSFLIHFEQFLHDSALPDGPISHGEQACPS